MAAIAHRAALAEGFVSVTPLHLDLTNDRALDEIGRWIDPGS